MLIAPGKGFVFLASTKTGSTSIETAFMTHSQIILRKPPAIKHTTYAGFQRYLQPYLKSKGFPRESYEVVCVFREPRSGQAEMDRIFRYDRLDLLVEFLCEKVGEEVEVGSANTSPERSFSLSEEYELEVRKFFAPEYRIYERAIGG